MKLLILAQSYPSKQNIYAQAYVHSRLLYYQKCAVHVEVISFACRAAYTFEGIRVHPASSFKALLAESSFDAIICHAPNIRNHMRLLLPVINTLPKIFFVFHGHEILRKSKYYPEEYQFNRNIFYNLKRKFDSFYDYIKCLILKHFIKEYGGKKLYLIFVSQYLKKLFQANVHLTEKEFGSFSTVIHNPLNPVFTKGQYNWSSQKKYDFITIRPFDKSVYAMDIILKIAEQNPKYSFHVYGQGKFFEYYKRPRNLKLINGYLSPAQIAKKLNSYKAALMPSHHDSQGVMVCEMAAFGIPVVVSDIPATREMLKSVKNKFFINNQQPVFFAEQLFKQLDNVPADQALKERLSNQNTCGRELELITKNIN
jgi:glycosyltransferase involved in cell wall biosynthesis